MNKRRLTLLIVAGMLILACNLPTFAGEVAVTEPSAPTAAEAVDVATDAPTSMATAVVVPSVSVPSVSVPSASPSTQAVNCRSGPGLSFDVVVLLPFGQTAEIVGKLADGSWLEVRYPATAASTCWVAASVVTTTGDLGGVRLVAAPPTPILPTYVAIIVTDVSVWVSPTTINVPGCVGPIQPSTAAATITVSGPTKLQWHFETDQNGKLPKHNLNFLKADSKGVEQSFTPRLKAGTYSVELFIDGMNLKGMDAVATYKIKC